MHDPERREEMQAARVAGGRGKSRLARAERLIPGTLRPVLATILTALGEVHRGELDPKQAAAMAALAGAAVRLFQVGQVEERLADLEAQITALARRPA